MHQILSSAWKGALDLLFAPTCVGCRGPIAPGSADLMVCGRCWSRCRLIPAPRCDRCWTPLPSIFPGETGECRFCAELRPAIRSVRSAYLLDETSRLLVHALKYRGWHAVARPMAERLAKVPLPLELRDEPPLLVPVPLSSTRLRERGYNQAAVIAVEIAALLGWDYAENALARRSSSTSQTTLHPTERRANVAGVFSAVPQAMPRLAARHVLIVDDVLTTGATALACGDALLAAGARAVSVVTFARALPELEQTARRAEAARRR